MHKPRERSFPFTSLRVGGSREARCLWQKEGDIPLLCALGLLGARSLLVYILDHGFDLVFHEA